MHKLKTYALAFVLIAGVPTWVAAQQPQADVQQAAERADQEDKGEWGWIGLLGLIGLAGLKRRDRERDTVVRTGTGRS
jgi:hypothetical protein